MAKRVAVLHAQVPFTRGGAETHVEMLTANLRRRGFDAELVTIPFKWYPFNTLFDSYFQWRNVDLTESNGAQIDLVIALKVPTFMARHPNKVAWVMHQFRQAYDLSDNIAAGGLNTITGGGEVAGRIAEMDQIGINESVAIYANSKNVAERLKKYNDITSTPLYHPPGLVGRYKSGAFQDYILSVGRLDEVKRIDLLIRALKYCDRHIRVKIAGRGPEMDNLKRLAHQLGVEDRVDFLGFVLDDDLIELYANALGVCFPPIDEDYGYITLEAFLSKKPIVTCRDSGGVLEFARQNKNAFISDADAEQIGKNFDKLYANKTRARQMGKEGYELVKDISWDNVIDELTRTI